MLQQHEALHGRPHIACLTAPNSICELQRQESNAWVCVHGHRCGMLEQMCDSIHKQSQDFKERNRAKEHETSHVHADTESHGEASMHLQRCRCGHKGIS